MTTSSLWSQIDPASDFRGATSSGYDQGASDPSRQTAPGGAPPWSPSNEHFGFGVTVALTTALLFYVYERGAGAGVRARVGKLKGEAGLDLAGKKGDEK